MLHTLFHSPAQCDFALLLRTLSADDHLLLLQDGVLAAMAGSRYWAALENAGIPVSVLDVDVAARGLSAQISNSVSQVSYNDFVMLTERHSQQMSW
ncbi:sulfurtransferase complex subunit TusB [Enterobacterales bacterium CwR94]|nr:sulfurtransferase complex subunit TusB [Enterobacterales bacterium CwR94]